MNTGFLGPAVTTVLTVYGIETDVYLARLSTSLSGTVTTVLTVYGIETSRSDWSVNSSTGYNSTYRLRYWNRMTIRAVINDSIFSYNSTYRLRYWNSITIVNTSVDIMSYNSTYRLRYWNNLSKVIIESISCWVLQQYLPFTVLKPGGTTDFPG